MNMTHEEQIKKARLELCNLQEMYRPLEPEYQKIMALIAELEEMLGIKN